MDLERGEVGGLRDLGEEKKGKLLGRDLGPICSDCDEMEVRQVLKCVLTGISHLQIQMRLI